MRRHSMNDGILSSAMEKINPYFTKNYSKSPLKSRNQYSKSSQLPTSPPKRSLSVTSLDIDQNSTLKSPPKRNKKLPIEADIFDFKSEPHGLQIKGESEEDFSSDELRKSETYSYSLLKGASKTSSVNPCFSSRKTFVKKLNSLPTKCLNSRFKQEYCSNNSKSCSCPYHIVKSPNASELLNSESSESVQNVQTLQNVQSIQNVQGIQKPSNYRIYDRDKDWVLRHGLISKPQNTSYIQKLIERSRPTKSQGQCSSSPDSPPGTSSTIVRNDRDQIKNEKIAIKKEYGEIGTAIDRTKFKPECDDTSPTTSEITIVTNSSLNSLKSTPGIANDSKKLELLNDSVLLSHAIAGNILKFS